LKIVVGGKVSCRRSGFIFIRRRVGLQIHSLPIDQER
jgi:hypothetical protein